MGRGGAFVAKADNPAAINYNPAGFAKLTGHRFVIGAHILNQKYSFARKGPYLAVDTQRPLFAAPTHVMFTTDFGLRKGFTVALGFYTPPSSGRDYPQTFGRENARIPSPQRYDALFTSGLILNPSLGLAYRVTPWLDIGATFQIWMVSTTAKTIATVSSACDTPEDPTCDVSVELKTADWFSPSGSLGVLLRPHRMFEIGLMFRFPAASEAEGQAKIEFGPGVNRLQGAMRFPLVEPENPKVTMTSNNPAMLRAGARVKFYRGDREVGDLELDFIFENWRSAGQRKVTLQANSLNAPMEPTLIDWNLLDTFAFRLGGAYELPLESKVAVIVRGGASFESATTAVSNTTLNVFSARRFGISLGLGIRWKWLTIDVAYTHLFFPKRIVNNSTIRATDFGGSGGSGPVVGNGTYESGLDMFSFQIGMAFGTGPK